MWFLLREHHIESSIIKVITNTICESIYYLCINLFLYHLAFFNALIIRIRIFRFYLGIFFEIYRLIIRKATQNNVFFLVMLIINQLLKKLPLFEMGYGYTLGYHTCQSICDQSISDSFIVTRFSKILDYCLGNNKSPFLIIFLRKR